MAGYEICSVESIAIAKTGQIFLLEEIYNKTLRTQLMRVYGINVCQITADSFFKLSFLLIWDSCWDRSERNFFPCALLEKEKYPVVRINFNLPSPEFISRFARVYINTKGDAVHTIEYYIYFCSNLKEKKTVNAEYIRCTKKKLPNQWSWN